MTEKIKAMKKRRSNQTNRTTVHLRKLEQRYMKEQSEVEEDYLTKQATWLLNNTYICYDGESSTNIDNDKKQHFLQHKKKHKNTKEACTEKIEKHRKENKLCKSINSYHQKTAEMMTIKIALKEIHKREEK